MFKNCYLLESSKCILFATDSIQSDKISKFNLDFKKPSLIFSLDYLRPYSSDGIPNLPGGQK